LARNSLLEPATGRSRRLILIVGALTLAGSTAFLSWWMTTLSGLPDIGDPFDVAAFADTPVPDDENAFVLYREAVKKLVEEPAEITYDWGTTGPVGKGWLQRNREALEVWRRGTERPKALYMPPRTLTVMTQLPVIQQSREFARLAQLEGSRLEAEGDLEGAWRWHRAIFRSSRHVGQRGTMIERLVGRAMYQVASRQITRWASDTRVTPALLRQALDAVIADYEMTPPLSDCLKVEYLGFVNTFEDPALVWKCLNEDSIRRPGPPDWLSRNNSLFSLARVVKKEPERSRRVLRLIYANLLEVCDLPPDRRPPVTCSLPNLTGAPGSPMLVDLYQLDNSTPARSRALPPDEILEWYRSSLYATHLSPAVKMIFNVTDAERTSQANLVITLANRLYEIERGKPPETVEELVGPYLKALPAGYKRIEP
jgi:hypothetical protein